MKLALLTWTSLTVAWLALSCQGNPEPSDANAVDADVADGDGESDALSDADSLPELDEIHVDLEEWAGEIVVQLPGRETEALRMPDDDALDHFGRALSALLADDVGLAVAEAAAVDYVVLRLHDEGGDSGPFFALQPDTGNEDGRGHFVVRREADLIHSVIVGAPHPGFELGTAGLAARSFRALGARGLAVAGAHRCANTAATVCDGVSSVCTDGPDAYRESDVAHQDRSFFQVFHQRLLDHANPTTVISLHGKGTDTDDPEAIISDGTTADGDADRWITNRLTAILEARTAAAGSTRASACCNRVGDADSLCGTTNVQGRAANGVPPERVCTDGADGSTGRFLHLELSRDLRLGGTAVGPDLVVETLVELLAPGT